MRSCWQWKDEDRPSFAELLEKFQPSAKPEVVHLLLPRSGHLKSSGEDYFVQERTLATPAVADSAV
jgi:hypothetical protein